METLNYLTLLTALANLSLGLLVFLKGKKQAFYSAFFVFTIFDAIWAFSNFYFGPISPSFFIFQSQYSFGGAVLISALPWILLLTEKTPKKSKIVLTSFLTLTLLLL